ncbi:MAG TPA: beta-ketoacyl synthase N-terminal-like domain-containing protein [Terriglobales bacterium]|nr:beta-ketoacyl synthase N-terminal-like domain-containing protein [Terriglobales bacterium]
MSAAPRRVAVTGLAALSPAGAGLAAYRGWRAGGSPAVLPTALDLGAILRDPKRQRSMHRTFQLGTAAAVLALRAAALEIAKLTPERAGVAAALADPSPFTADLLRSLDQTLPRDGSALRPSHFAETALHQLHPFRRLALLPNLAAAHTSLLLGLQGPSFTFTSGTMAGEQTLIESFWTIAEGRADLMLCQTAEAGEQSYPPQAGAELAGAAVLENWEHAVERSAPILAEFHPYSVLPAPNSLASPARNLLDALDAFEVRAAALKEQSA